MNAQTNTQDETRARWMSILAKSDFSDFESLWSNLPSKPTWTTIRRPETGMVMVRGKTGGGGAPFNLGEMTVTRCVIRLDQGPTGFGYVAGRNTKHAELAAVVDAMMQISSSRRTLEQSLIMPLELCASARREKRSRKAASTQVDFFTLVRGE